MTRSSALGARAKYVAFGHRQRRCVNRLSAQPLWGGDECGRIGYRALEKVGMRIRNQVARTGASGFVESRFGLAQFTCYRPASEKPSKIVG